MTLRRLERTALTAALAGGALIAQPSPFAWKKIDFPDGGRLEFRAQLPTEFDPGRGAPVVLVFCDGAQDREAVWNELAAHWFRQAHEHGWAVVLPVAPKEGRFHEGGETRLPPLLYNLRTGMRIHGNRMHVVGIGEGAASAFRVVAEHGHEFASLITTGASAVEARDQARVRDWVVIERHDSFESAVVWSSLVARREALQPPDTSAGRVASTLDDWHDAAARADADRYFGAFTEDGVFLGTDASERWTVNEFRAFGAEYFERRSAWIYVPIARNVMIAPEGNVAWFDESLGHARFGECRGTGVLRRVDEAWKIAHYSLTVPIPNDLLDDFVTRIKDAGEK